MAKCKYCGENIMWVPVKRHESLGQYVVKRHPVSLPEKKFGDFKADTLVATFSQNIKKWSIEKISFPNKIPGWENRPMSRYETEYRSRIGLALHFQDCKGIDNVRKN